MNDISVRAWLADSSSAQERQRKIRHLAAKQQTFVIDLGLMRELNELLLKAKSDYDAWVRQRCLISIEAFAKLLAKDES